MSDFVIRAQSSRSWLNKIHLTTQHIKDRDIQFSMFRVKFRDFCVLSSLHATMFAIYSSISYLVHTVKECCVDVGTVIVVVMNGLNFDLVHFILTSHENVR